MQIKTAWRSFPLSVLAWNLGVWKPCLVALCAGCLLSACADQNTAAVAQEPQNTETEESASVVIPVEVEMPHRGSISHYFETQSRIEADSKVDVTAEGVGKCIRVFADEGDKVRKGDPLAELDKEEAQAQLRQNEVQLRQRKGDYERAKSAHEAGLLPKTEMESARFAYEQAQSTVELQRIQLENLTIRAPIDGMVIEKLIQEGQLVSSGTPVFRVVNPATFRVVINPPERELSRLSVGQSANLRVDAIPDAVFEARVSKINPNVDPATGTIKVELAFNEETQQRLHEAMFTRVRLVMETRENALLVPKEAVIEETGRRYVFVAKKATAEPQVPVEEGGENAPSDPPVPHEWVAERREVKTGLENSSEVEILSGVDEEDVLITVGQYNLNTGSPIRITSADEAIQANLDMEASEALERAREKRGPDGAPREAMHEAMH